MSCDQDVIPIACRFVASDQWLTARFDTTWKISEVKQYILSKVYNRTIVGNDNLPTEDRPVSPITFASARNSFDSNPDFFLEDDLASDLGPYNFMEPPRQTRLRQTPTQRLTSPSVPESPTDPLAPLHPRHYSMLAFSTGQLLEDDYSLAWYRLRPHELLELHPPGTIVGLQRDVMLEYVKPYLELDVRALRVITSDKDKDKDMHALGSACGAPDMSSPNKARKAKDTVPCDPRSPVSASGSGCVSPGPQSMRKRKKMKLEWRERYLVIRQGMLSLFKSRTDLTPVHTCSLAMLTTLRGQEDVVQVAAASMPSPHVVCARFRAECSAPSIPEPQSSPSPTTEQWNDPWFGGTIPRETEREGGFLWGRRESKDDLKQQRRSTAETGETIRAHACPKEDLVEGRTPDAKGENIWYDTNFGDGPQGTWLVLDTLDGFAHSNLLRVLHRCSPATISTTLIPSYLLPDSSLSSPSSISSTLPSYAGALRRSPCPYPEWRTEVSRRAQQSGLGDLGDAMSWILCGGPPLDPSNPKHRGTELHKKPLQVTIDDTSTPPDTFEFDADVDDRDGDGCELEWDLWATDLTRQALANATNNIALPVAEPVPIMPATYPHRRIRPTASSSTFSSVTLSEQPISPGSPTGHRPREIPAGANLGLLSSDSPALLTAPSVLPFQSTGVTTSTVSAGGIVRTRSLISIDGGRGRGVARAMEILAEDGDGGGAQSPGKQRRRKRMQEENNRGVLASSAPARSTVVPTLTPNTITSTTVTVHESGTPSPTQTHGSPFWEGSPSVTSSVSAGLVSSGGISMPDDLSTISSGQTAVTTTTTTTTTTIQLLPHRPSIGGGGSGSGGSGGEMPGPDASSPSQKRGDKSGKGKGKVKQTKSPTRGMTFSPERLVSKLDSALDFVTG